MFARGCYVVKDRAGNAVVSIPKSNVLYKVRAAASERAEHAISVVIKHSPRKALLQGEHPRDARLDGEQKAGKPNHVTLRIYRVVSSWYIIS